MPRLPPFLAMAGDDAVGGSRFAIEEVRVQKVPVEPQAERAPDPRVGQIGLGAIEF